MSVVWQQVLAAIAAITAAAVIFIFRVGMTLFERYVDSKLEPTQAAHANELLNAVQSAATASVEALNQTVVYALKANGIFSSAMGADLKATAIRQVKLQLGPTLTAAAGNLFGDFDQIIANKIEQAVWRSKSQAAVLGGSGASQTATSAPNESQRAELDRTMEEDSTIAPLQKGP